MVLPDNPFEQKREKSMLPCFWYNVCSIHLCIQEIILYTATSSGISQGESLIYVKYAHLNILLATDINTNRPCWNKFTLISNSVDTGFWYTSSAYTNHYPEQFSTLLTSKLWKDLLASKHTTWGLVFFNSVPTIYKNCWLVSIYIGLQCICLFIQYLLSSY